MISAYIVVAFSVAYLTLVTSDPCTPPGESINASSGHISSPNFPNNYDVNRICTWNITVPSGRIIKLTLLSFTLVANENEDCSGAASTSARVLITNVASHGGDPNNFKLCGQKPHHPVYSIGNFIQVRFESRTGPVNKGFNASFEAIDGDSLCPTDMILNETSGSFSSPFNPRNYPFNQTCSWNITGKQGYRVELTIPDYNLHQCDAICSCDYLEVQSGFSDDAQAGKLCGSPRNIVNLTFYSIHKSLRVVFVSDDTKFDYDGFGATYKLLNFSPPICPKEAIPLTGSGKISSTNYPKSNYTASRNCTWKITVPADKIVMFVLTDFALSECLAKPCSDSCSYVELYDGGSMSSPSLGRFCQGSPQKEPQLSSGNQMFVMFHPGLTVARGFEAEYKYTTTGVLQTMVSSVSSLVTPTPSHTTPNSGPSVDVRHSSGSGPSVHIGHSSSSTYSTTKGLIASSLTTEGGPGPSSIISSSTVSVTPSSTPQPNQCSNSEKPNKESTCGEYVIHLLKNPWKDEYLHESSMDYKELKNLLSSLFCDIFKEVVSKAWLPELTFSKANGNWTIVKGKVCVVLKPGDDFYIEDAKFNFAANYTFKPIGVTFSEWKAKDGECKKCDGGGGPFVIESVCESKEYSCRGYRNKLQESKDCVKHCSSASNLVVAAVSNLILAMWISLSFKF